MASFPRRGEIWLVDFPDDPRPISPAILRDIEQCLLRAFGIAT